MKSLTNLEGPGSYWARTGHRVVVAESREQKLDREIAEHYATYYNFDGQNYYMKHIVYACPVCGRTVRQPVISYYQVNADCRHGTNVYEMVRLGIV